jgi:formylglycine-generating enzyme required for sulfatase activity
MSGVRENFRTVERLHHPNIAALKTLELDPASGAYYLVMELAEGTDLHSWRKRQGGKVGLESCLPILRQIAQALDYAHSRKIIHRDIKPANVKLGPDGGVKVLDLGLAAEVQASLSRVSQARYSTSGTGPYMAPEQWRGQRQTGATDQYALAVTTYELLAGYLPFETPDKVALRESVLHDLPERPEGMPDAVWAALSRGLAKEREGRYPSCKEFVDALQGGKQDSAKTQPILQEPAGPEPASPTPREEGPPRLDAPWTNSLGMRFAPVPGTQALFSVWDTRVQDYETYALARSEADASWKSPGFEQGPAHPVVKVSWEDAQGFCRWLTETERAAGLLPPELSYRLPTDAQWSAAVGLDEPDEGTPKDKDMKIQGVYPWGTEWPPPKGAGNYDSSLRGHDYARTSPVGSFAANRYGLYDMGGNVSQWCEDWYDTDRQNRVLRGGSWYDRIPDFLLSSFRLNRSPDYRCFYIGFRVVLAGGPSLAAEPPCPTPGGDSPPGRSHE